MKRIAMALVLAAAAALPARAQLDSARWREVLEKIETAIEEGADKDAAAAIPELAKDDSERAAKVLTKVLARFAESVPVYRAAQDALGSFKNPKALKLLQDEVSGAGNSKVRVILFDGLARGKKLPFPVIVKALSDKAEGVALAAIAEIARSKSAAGAEALCDFMANIESKGGVRGVAWQAARNALVRMLGVEREGGQDFKNYLVENRARFVEGKGILSEARGGSIAAEKGRPAGETTIFGQPIHCKNVVIILDVSGSMAIPDPLPEGPGTVLRNPEQNGIDESRRRIVRAKNELKRVLGELAKSRARVNLVAYSTDVSFWKPQGLWALDAETLRSAEKFVDGFEADGVTATDSAIELAFEAIPEADCFYLISDGFATHDGTTKVPTKMILDRIRELNRLRHAQINTLGFVSPVGAPSADKELMEAIADLTGGTYSEIR
jgi:hypothetical protein